MKFSAFDLNSIRALHYLLEEAHVARAAARLHITPAAASNALQRLRNALGDPLLVRSARTLVRTARGEQLRLPAREVVEAAQRLLTPKTFAPELFSGTFQLFTSDRMAEVLLPHLDTILSKQSPLSNLWLRAAQGQLMTVLRDTGGIAIVPAGVSGDGLHQTPLFTERFVCVLRKGNPLLRGPWTVTRYSRAVHVVVAPLGESLRSPIDDVLASTGHSRRVSRVVSAFSSARLLILRSNCVGLLPSSYLTLRSPGDDFVLRTPPMEVPSIPMTMVWHSAHEFEPSHRWLRETILKAVQLAGLKNQSKS